MLPGHLGPSHIDSNHQSLSSQLVLLSLRLLLHPTGLLLRPPADPLMHYHLPPGHLWSQRSLHGLPSSMPNLPDRQTLPCLLVVQNLQTKLHADWRPMLSHMQPWPGLLRDRQNLLIVCGPQLPELFSRRQCMHPLQPPLRRFQWRLPTYPSSYVESCNNNSKVAYFQHMNSVCLPLDSSCPDVMPTYYKNKAMLKCNECPNGMVAHLDKCIEKCPNNYRPN